MIPQNENETPVAMVLKELSWIDRMQQKLETLCEGEAGRNSGEVLQETSAFLENQFSTLGTNMRKFCAEFVQELLLPADSSEKAEISRAEDHPQSATAAPNGAGGEKAVKVVDKPIFHLEGSSAAVMPVIATLKLVHPEKAQAEGKVEDEVGERPATLSNEASNSSISSEAISTVSEQSELAMSSSSSKSKQDDCEEYAQWFVSEEYRRMRLGMSSSTSSLESWDGHQRAGSCDSLLDWELV